MIKKIGIIMAISALIANMAIAVALNGAGATFPYPIYSKWVSEYNKITGVKINYQPIGSGGGIRQFTSGITDFGGTDDPMTDEDIKSAGADVLHIPTVMGAVAVSYNLPGIAGIKLDADTLSKIFLGEIRKWNDSRIAAINPGIVFPDKNITVAHRSDGSGTTAIFSSYMAKVSSVWAAKVGKGKSLNWPVGVGGKGNSGVAGIIKMNEGAVGYVELSYAITNNLPVASLKNRSGNFVEPTLDSTAAAAAGVLNKMPSDFRMDLTNASGRDSYPIVGLTWLIVRKNQANHEKGEALASFLKWAVTSGQKYAGELLYAPLPAGLQNKVLAVIESIKY